MTTRSIPRLAVFAIAFATPAVAAAGDEEFPRGAGRLDARRGEPGLPGDRRRRLGPEDPRARVYPGRGRDLPPLVHRLQRRPVADQVPRPCHLARRPPLDPRPGQPDLHRVVGRGRLRRPPRRPLPHVRRGEERHRPPARPRPTASTGPTTARSTSARPTARRSPPAPTAPRPPGSRTAPGTSFTSAATAASGSRPRRTAGSGPTSTTSPSSPGPRALRPRRRGDEPDHQARRRLLRLLPRQLPRPWKDWTTCLARSRDLVHWEKYPATRSSPTTAPAPSSSRPPKATGFTRCTRTSRLVPARSWP